MTTDLFYMAIDDLVISDGVTSDGTGYHVVSWQPITPKLKDSWFAESPFDRVTERMTIDIIDGPNTSVQARLQRLKSVLTKAALAAASGDNYKLFKVKTTGTLTGSAALAARIRFMPEETLDLPPSFITSQGMATLRVHIAFVRSGFYFDTNTVYTGATASTANGNRATGTIASFPTNRSFLPCDYVIGNIMPTIGTNGPPKGIIAINHDQTAQIKVVPLQSAGVVVSDRWDQQGDSANNPTGGAANVLRYTNGTLNEITSPGFHSFTTPNSNKPYMLFLKYRNNNIATSYKVRINASGGGIFLKTNPVVLAPTTTNVFIAKLGILPLAANTLYNLDISAQSSATAGNIDFDSLLMVPIDVNRTCIVEIANLPQLITGTQTIELDHNFDSTSLLAPNVRIIEVSPSLLAGTSGRPYAFADAANFDAVNFFIGNASTRWCYVNTVGNTIQSLTTTARALDIVEIPT